jgi:hypothetical protein
VDQQISFEDRRVGKGGGQKDHNNKKNKNKKNKKNKNKNKKTKTKTKSNSSSSSNSRKKSLSIGNQGRALSIKLAHPAFWTFCRAGFLQPDMPRSGA